MYFLFTLSFIARVGLSDRLKALPQPLASRMLLRISEELVSLRPNLPALIIGQLLTHLLNQYQQRPPRAFTITAPFGQTPGTFDDRLRLLLMPEPT
ncbi:MAG TPA: hypothetical protein VFX63_13830 [Pyrinomonadaceae bacterium]|nr:hypothetical protein [Pyrinomonadaceae bacterium]